MIDKLMASIEDSRNFVIDLQKKLVSIPALGPDNGGDGEKDKADYLMGLLKELGVTGITEMNAPDDRVSCGYRPNIAAVIPGSETGRTLWIISHMDIVPAGDESLWTGDPFELTVDGDKLVGRGVQDNHQGIALSMVLARAMMQTGVTPPMNLGLMFVADEETSSTYGLKYIAEHHRDIFKDNDLIVIPDFGEDDASLIEVAEKSMMWLKVQTDGKQCHASTPGEGVNALVAGADMTLRLRELYTLFNDENPLFDPPFSTFEPTKKEPNVPNVNTIPGRDLFYVDCRVLPHYELEKVAEAARQMAQKTEAEFGVTVTVTTPLMEKAAPATPEDSEVVALIKKAVKDVYGVNAKPAGIGGGTVAAVLRNMGVPCAVWSTSSSSAHQPDEYASIKGQIGDAKVMAKVLFGE